MNCFAYIRVSTTKQRDQGASLEAQRDAIERYARKHDLTITEWFEETKTAALQGRSEFARLIKRLRAGEARGAIVHKIDRSARNLKDWSDFIGLMEHGVAIHIASENLDLSSRGGRLSADIQAVVAADYIRNLRLEALKGIRARYQQGLLPGMAPIGYENNGSGQAKTIHPVMGPLVRELFERYATKRYNLKNLAKTMNGLGLRNHRGNRLGVNSVSRILNQPFYTGLLLHQRSGETFPGVHEPLITRALFEACQDVLHGRTQHQSKRHGYAFSRLIRCSHCDYSLIAERQKGRVYYRCHTKSCPVTSLREDAIDQELGDRLASFRLEPEHRSAFEARINELIDHRTTNTQAKLDALQLEYDGLAKRQDRLTDLLLDDVLDEDAYRKKKRRLQERQLVIKERMREPHRAEAQMRARVRKYLELAETAWLSFQTENPAHKRRVVEAVTSNLTASVENVAVELRTPFAYLAGGGVVLSGGGDRDEPRTPVTCRPDQTLAEKAAWLLDYIDAELEEEEASD